MARPNPVSPLQPSSTPFQVGGTVAVMHEVIETSLLSGKLAGPERWDAENRFSATEDVLYHASRVVGIAALVAGFVGAGFFLSSFL